MKKTPLRSWSFHNLLAWLLFYQLLSPALFSIPSARVLGSLLFSGVLFSAVYIINQRSKMFIWTIFFMGLTLLLFWIDVFNLISFSLAASSVIICLYLGIIVYVLSLLIFSVRDITPALISGALCLYLLFGMFWGMLYVLLELLRPDSFTGALLVDSVNHPQFIHSFQYFSLVTLTTLGYGDILPKTPIAASFCQIEAVIGQFFMAVLVARLVGIQVAGEFGANH
jgi:hypothetical protein